MATDSDRQPTNQSAAEIRQAVVDARKAVNRYDHTCLELAVQNRDPQDSQKVRQAHIEMHSSVMNAFRALRGEVRLELEDYWGVDDKGQMLDDAEILYAHNGNALVGLQSLERFEGVYTHEEQREHSRHGGAEITREVKPQLIPPIVCRRAVSMFAECLKKLGLGPEISKERPFRHMEWDFVDEYIEAEEEGREPDFSDYEHEPHGYEYDEDADVKEFEFPDPVEADDEG